MQEEEGGEEAVMRGEAAGLIYGPSGMAVEAEGQADRSEDVESEAVEGETTGSMAGNGAHEAASLPTRTLVWEQIEDSSGSSADLALYHDVALLRQRCHGDGVSFAQDAHGVHIIQPFDESEAAEKRARSEAYGRLNGNVRGACLLLADKRDGGVATVEAFSCSATPKRTSGLSAPLRSSGARLPRQRPWGNAGSSCSLYRGRCKLRAPAGSRPLGLPLPRRCHEGWPTFRRWV